MLVGTHLLFRGFCLVAISMAAREGRILLFDARRDEPFEA
jgi:hypothetical protein